MKSKAAKRILSLLLAAVMLCSLSVAAFADGEEPASVSWPKIKEDGGFRFNIDGQDAWTVTLPVVDGEGNVVNEAKTFTSANVTVENLDEPIIISEEETNIQKKVGTIILDYGDDLILNPTDAIELNPSQAFAIEFEPGDNGAALKIVNSVIDLKSGLVSNVRFFSETVNGVRTQYFYDIVVKGTNLLGTYPSTWTYDADEDAFTIESNQYLIDYTSYSLQNRLLPTWGTTMNPEIVDFSTGAATVALTNKAGTSKNYTINLVMPWRVNFTGQNGYNIESIKAGDDVIVSDQVSLETAASWYTEILPGKIVEIEVSPYGEGSANKVIKSVEIINDTTNAVLDGVSYDGNTIKFTMPDYSVRISSITFEEQAPQHLVTADAASLILDDGTIGVNFKMILSGSMVNNDAVKAVFIYKNKEYPVSVEGMNPDDQGRYVFTYRVPAKEFANEIGLKFMNGDEIIPMKYKDSGNPVEGNILNYSGQTYSQSLPDDDAYKPLVTALQNYCAWAYKGLGDTVDTPPEFTEGYYVSGVKDTDLLTYKASKTGEVTGLTLKAYSLTLKTTTAVNLKFELDEGHNIDEYTFSLSGGKTPEVKQSGQYWVVTIPDIAAKDIDTMYTLTVTNGSETMTVSCSALSYGYTVLKNGLLTEDMQNTVRAMYLYNQKANERFGG